MAYSKAEMKEEAKEYATSGKPSPYPWGLCIRLESEELEKLGITDLPGVGDEFHILAVAKVTGCNQSAREGQDEETSVALQITMMQVLLRESAAMEKGEKESPKSEARETKKTLLGS
jgi:hypothetical protein